MTNQELFESIQMGHKEKKVLSLSKKLVKKCSFNRGSDVENLCHLAYVAESGLTPKNFITPTSFDFRAKDYYKIGDMFATTNYLIISAPEISDEMLADILNMEDEPLRSPFVSDAFRRKILDSSLVGFKFELAWDSDEK